MSLTYVFSRAFLTRRWLLWSLFWSNLLGTAYGYYWYGDQLVFTAETMPRWYLPFVPDSPTASLFFTMSVLFILFEQKYGWKKSVFWTHLRGFVDAFGLITLIKYGVWAVVMIVSAAALGNPVNWQDYMLSASHIAMAVEALLFARLYRYRFVHIVIVAIWSFANDYMDYVKMTYPSLPRVLDERLASVRWFTSCLSVITIIIALICLPFNVTSKERSNVN
ncbi:DUF1405 domain-containing protein [Paenibacillus chartarius]|uniref:DUF1405 domain-containing protein n=1 Tax=Paenibacillus chartarius TaxID=747481 RepID=A0ABV6DQ99_9BACL